MVRLFPAKLQAPQPSVSLLIYQQVKPNGTIQVGILGTVDAEDHAKGIIRAHEQVITTPMIDRRKVFAQSCVDPIMLMYRENHTVSSIMERIMRTNEPLDTWSPGTYACDTLWLMQEPEDVHALQTAFQSVDRLYIADGHHRTAAACSGDRGDGSTPTRFLPALIFPDAHLSVLSYHRCVGRLPHGMSSEDLLSRLLDGFEVEKLVPRCVCDPPDSPREAPPSPVTVARRSSSGEDVRARMWANRASTPEPSTLAVPSEQDLMHMFLAGSWYVLRLRSDSRDRQGHLTPLEFIGCQILLDRVLKPIFGLAETSSSDNCLIYVDGREGAEGVEARVRSGAAAVGFLVAPVPPAEIMRVADAGQLLPAKATYFDPKPTPGLLAALLR